MYCTSDPFISRMQICIDAIQQQSGGALAFEEYIPLPHFGHTILRFSLRRDGYTLNDLDAYEALMQRVVKDDFLVDFMGDMYRHVGFEPQMYERQFIQCYHKYHHEPISVGNDQAQLQSDAAPLLSHCGLPADARVWEIQLDDEIALFVLGKENRKIGTHPSDDRPIHVYEVDEIPCIGLMRAMMHAKAQHVSLARVLLEA